MHFSYTVKIIWIFELSDIHPRNMPLLKLSFIFALVKAKLAFNPLTISAISVLLKCLRCISQTDCLLIIYFYSNYQFDKCLLRQKKLHLLIRLRDRSHCFHFHFPVLLFAGPMLQNTPSSIIPQLWVCAHRCNKTQHYEYTLFFRMLTPRRESP